MGNVTNYKGLCELHPNVLNETFMNQLTRAFLKVDDALVYSSIMNDKASKIRSIS